MKSETFPTIPQALLLVLALFLLQVLVQAVLGDLRNVLDLTIGELMAFTTLLGNGLILATLMHWKSMSYRDLFNPSGASFMSSAVLVGIPVVATVPMLFMTGAVLEELLTQIFPMSAWEQRVFEEMAAQNLANVTAVCLLAPVLEEMLFRGLILRSFLGQYQRSTAIGASALLFGVAHLNIYQFVAAFAIGLLLGWLYERTRSLVPCIALHGAYNTSVTILGVSDQTVTFDPSTWFVSAAFGAAGGYALYRLLGTRSAPAPRNPDSRANN